jgi:hypothetical protein
MAFATPGGTDAAALKRKQTVDEWARAYRVARVGEPGTYQEGPRYEMQNDWLTGFCFDKITSRSRTDNKVFDIQDPRGFTLQIYSDCMEDILLDGSIVRGEIQGECRWARQGAKMYLLLKDSPVHLEWLERQRLKQEQKGERIVPGDIVSQTGDPGDREVFIGNVYHVNVGFEEVDRQGSILSSRHYYSSYYSRDGSRRYRIVIKVDEKPWKGLVDVRDSSNPYVHTKRQWPKKSLKLGHDDDMLALKLASMTFDGIDPRWSGSYGTSIYFRSLDALRKWLADQAADDYSHIREAWSKNHPNTVQHTYELLDDVSVIVTK